MKIILASHNANKVKEIQELVPKSIEIASLKDINYFDDILETETTFVGNSSLKANCIFKKFGVNVIADDSGLEVEALNNEPGVYSARYAGENANDENNISLLLKNLEGIENRKARFVCVITLILNEKEYHFEGEIKGKISNQKTGTSGFGYDPIFIPENETKSFAELSSEQKNKISHRAKAIEKLVDFLTAQNL
jgi:XTP/dITP diphosphohydrolase